MVKFDSDHENQIIEALDALSNRNSTNLKALAQECSVLYNALKR
jgi:hypothetical protein